MRFDKSQFEIGSKYDPLILAVLEGGVFLIIGILGWVSQQPLIFPSLGPTAYELIEMPHLPSARTYNILVGHFTALGAGFLALAVLHAWPAPAVAVAGSMPLARVYAATIAIALTAGVNLIFKSSQPAACATALMISLGSRQTAHDAWIVVAGVVLIALLGKPLRQLRSKKQASTTA